MLGLGKWVELCNLTMLGFQIEIFFFLFAGTVKLEVKFLTSLE